MINRIRVVFVAALLVAGLAACGSSSSGPTSAGGSGSGVVQSGTANVTIQNFAFHPSSLTVKAGTKVTFTNEDTTPHTTTATSTKGFDSGALSKGQSYTMTFTKPGTYSYICTIHPYMKGTIIVK